MTQEPISLSNLLHRPQYPKSNRTQIGLIGCGGITVEHLTAYKKAGLQVKWLCDIRMDLARSRAKEFFPEAQVVDDYRHLLNDDSVEVVDVATHPSERLSIIRDCLLARKHVLSQKPFVDNIEDGQRLVDLADRQGVLLAVNQNARWAPHYRFAHSAISAGLLGSVFAVHLRCHWDHTWVRGTEFEKIRHLILYDYAIHWFDLVRYFFGGTMPHRVYASTSRVPDQDLAPNLLAQAILEFEEGQASLAFDAGVVQGQMDYTFIAGSRGTVRSSGPSIQRQEVELCVDGGRFTPNLEGSWFPDGFLGTMGELLLAIEENRQPTISARDNLNSLILCFAAMQSADTGAPIVPGSATRMPG